MDGREIPLGDHESLLSDSPRYRALMQAWSVPTLAVNSPDVDIWRSLIVT
jgi:hypothetical protein